MTDRLHEDSVRFARQRLIALEEGREKDAELLKNFILVEFGLELHDVRPDAFPKSYTDLWQIPARVGLVSIMLNQGREPIWRIPYAEPVENLPDEYEGVALNLIPDEYLVLSPGPMETPLVLLPPDPVTGERFVGRNAPEHLQPRKGTSGPIPDEIMAAIRPWTGG